MNASGGLRGQETSSENVPFRARNMREFFKPRYFLLSDHGQNTDV